MLYQKKTWSFATVSSEVFHNYGMWKLPGLGCTMGLRLRFDRFWNVLGIDFMEVHCMWDSLKNFFYKTLSHRPYSSEAWFFWRIGLQFVVIQCTPYTPMPQCPSYQWTCICLIFKVWSRWLCRWLFPWHSSDTYHVNYAFCRNKKQRNVSLKFANSMTSMISQTHDLGTASGRNEFELAV